jgi:hypothetical protein
VARSPAAFYRVNGGKLLRTLPVSATVSSADSRALSKVLRSFPNIDEISLRSTWISRRTPQ